jgi:hypothetical protein
MKYIFFALALTASINFQLYAQDSIQLERAKVTAGGALLGSFGSLIAYQGFLNIYDHLDQIKQGNFRSYLQCRSGIVIDSMPKAITMLGVAVGGAIIGGGLVYWLHKKADKEFEAHKFENLNDAQQRLYAFKNNESIRNVLNTKNIEQVQNWFVKADHDKAYNYNAPISSAYKFIFNQRDELTKIQAEYQRLALYFEGPYLSGIKADLKDIKNYVVTLNYILGILINA